MVVLALVGLYVWKFVQAKNVAKQIIAEQQLVSDITQKAGSVSGRDEIYTRQAQLAAHLIARDNSAHRGRDDGGDLVLHFFAHAEGVEQAAPGGRHARGDEGHRVGPHGQPPDRRGIVGHDREHRVGHEEHRLGPAHRLDADREAILGELARIETLHPLPLVGIARSRDFR